MMVRRHMLSKTRNWWQERREWKRIEDRIDHRMPVSRYLFFRWVRRAIVGYAVLFLGFLGNNLIDRQRAQDGRQALVDSSRIVVIEGCNRDFRTIQKLRGVFNRAEESIKVQHRAGLITDDQYKRGIDFYEQQLL